MEDTQVKSRSENQPADTPVQVPNLKSRFDDAEYARWSEKLRAARNKSK
jgi:hypothetical protein